MGSQDLGARGCRAHRGVKRRPGVTATGKGQVCVSGIRLKLGSGFCELG